MMELAIGTLLDRSGMCFFGIYVLRGYFGLNFILNPSMKRQDTKPRIYIHSIYIHVYIILPNIWKCCILSKKMVESTSGTILDRFCMCKIGIYVLAKHSGVQLADEKEFGHNIYIHI